jgi:hypothetical protein
MNRERPGGGALASSRSFWSRHARFRAAFGKLDEVLATTGEDQVTVKIRLQSQPWRMYSGVIFRSVLAASTLREGKEAGQ